MEATKLFTVLFAALFLSLALVSAVTFSQGIDSQNNIATGIVSPTSTIPTSPMSLFDGNVLFASVLGNNVLNLFAAIDYTKLQAGKDYSTSIIVTNGITNATIPVSVIKNFCTNGENASDIVITGIDANKDFDSWNPLDDITLTVTVENNNESKQKIEVEVSLYSIVDNTLVKIDGSDKKFTSTYSIADGEDHDFDLNFKISPKLEEGDYRLLVKAYKSGSETTKCTGKSAQFSDSYYQDIRVDYDSKELLIDNSVGPTSLTCGQTDYLSFDFYNLAYGDDETFRVKLVSVDKNLGIDVTSENFKLDNGKMKSFQLPITIPNKVLSGTQYDLKLVLEYNYQEDSDTFSESNTDYNYILNVGACEALTRNATITATLSDSTPKAVVGSQTIIETTVTNTGKTATTYTIEVTGNSAWSKATVDPSTSFTLNAGESKDVKVYLDVTDTATTGDKEFTIKANYGTGAIEQKVKLTVEKGFTAQALVNHFKTNWYIYAIVLVNLVLIIAIILVVKSLVKKN